MITLATAPAVMALVGLAGDAGLPKRLAAPLAVILGVALALVDHCFAGSGVYGAVADGLLLGLGAARLSGGVAPTGGRHVATG